MSTVSYLMSLATAPTTLEDTVAIVNITGMSDVLRGEGFGEEGSKTLSIIPKGRQNKEEMITQLQAMSAVHSVAVVTLSNPVDKSEVAAVRHEFSAFGLDTSEISDEELSLFLNAKIKGERTYYLKFGLGNAGEIDKVTIRPITEQPGYSPERFSGRDPIIDEDPDKVYTVDNFVVLSVELPNLVFEDPSCEWEYSEEE